MLELDASNPVKFSRHLVVVLSSGCLFRNVTHVKEYAQYLHDALCQSDCCVTKRVGGRLQQLTIVDLNVYGGNQNFRIMLSSKYEDRGLRPLQLYHPQYHRVIPSHDLTYEIFRNTLVACNGWKHTNLLAWPSHQQQLHRHIPQLNREMVPHARRHQRNIRFAGNEIRPHDRNHEPVELVAMQQYPQLKNYFSTYILPSWPQILDNALPPSLTMGRITTVE